MLSGKSRVKLWKWYVILPVLVVAIIAMTFVLRDDQSSRAASAQGSTTTKQCNSLGTLIESESIMNGKTKLGELDIYYNNTTGYNCAVTVALGQTRGKAKSMLVEIWSCKQKRPTNADCDRIHYVRDGGTYKYEAGPVGVYAKGHCISAEGIITWNGKGYPADAKPRVGHCS
jgi:hypothetical protein